MARITFNGISIDPLEETEGLRASEEMADAAESAYALVQTDGPPTREQRRELARVGVELHEYVPESTYLCRYAPADLAPVRALPFVVWAGNYLRGFKLAASLREGEPEGLAAALAAPAPDWPDDEARTVDVALHDDVDPRQAADSVAVAAGIDATTLEIGRRKVRLSATAAQLGPLTELDVVHHVEAVPDRTPFNDMARQILSAGVSINGTEYHGGGEVVCVADTGFDRGSRTNVHPAFAGRVARLYELPGSGGAADHNGHGTHVAGSVLGNGRINLFGVEFAVQGTAPRATLVAQCAGWGLGGIPYDLEDLFEPPYLNDGARVHTNSWGATRPGLPYDQGAEEIDDFVWRRPDMVVCFAAGNDGEDGDHNGYVDGESIGSFAAAKNCITVGASENLRPHVGSRYGRLWPRRFPKEPIKSDPVSDNLDDLAAFSSRGPTQEGRIKPDVVAPGTSILSTLSGEADPSDDWGPILEDQPFSFSTGTSMATPLVAGCAAVLRETLRRNGVASPSAARIKAMLINGAVTLPGHFVQNYDSGFGRVRLSGAVIVPDPSGNAGSGEGGPLDQGDEDRFTVTIPEGGEGGDPRHFSPSGRTFKITLVWTDPPGAALQNDLDLIVRVGSDFERHGNIGAGDGFDRANNVEQIVWTNIPAGEAEIVVRAHRITRHPQGYAYAWRLS